MESRTYLGVLLLTVAVVASAFTFLDSSNIDFQEDTVYTLALQDRIQEHYREGRSDEEVRVMVELNSNTTEEEYNTTRDYFAESGDIKAEFVEARSFAAAIKVSELLEVSKTNVEEIRIDQLNGIRSSDS